jgi:predicted nucleic acid-binding protein
VSVIVDASMAIAWLFDDEPSDTPEMAMGRVMAEGAVVPAVWRLEVANALRNAVRRSRCTEIYADDCLERLKRLRIVTDSETDTHAWSSTQALSRRHNLTPYDASYLELAVRLDAALATLDGPLLHVARKLGLDTIGD